MDVLEELTEFEDRIDRAHIERRIADWRQRLADLYADVEAWLPAHWSAVPGADVQLHDELLVRFGVPDQALPVLTLQREGVAQGRLEPRGLWIIGANGRVDLVLPPRHYIIIDRADNFATPRWMMTDIKDRLNERILSAQTLRASLG